MGVRWVNGIIAALVCAFGGCSGGGKINEQFNTVDALRTNNQAVALIRFTPPDPSCTALGMQIGVRQGELYKPLQTLRLEKLAVTNVMEALLAPGDYHVLSLTCVRKKSMQTLWEPQGNGLLRRSYASFSVTAGEVVNLGQIRIIATGRSAGIHGAFTNVAIKVDDWPLMELARFKSQRPKLFAAMHTRLMTPASAIERPQAAAIECAELKQLKTGGKLQNLPAACLGSTAAAAAKR